METQRPQIDDVARLLQRSRRRKRTWLFAAIVLVPFLLPTSYLASIGVIVWGQSSGVLSDQMSSRIPQWYAAPYSIYMMKSWPGSWQILKFLVWCSWMGDDEDRTWDDLWEEHRLEYQQTLDALKGVADQ